MLRRAAVLAAIFSILALSLLLVRSWKIDYDYSIDFQTYWLAGKRVAEGASGELYAPGGGEADGTPVAMAAHEFKNIPLVAVPFASLAGLDYPAAKRLFWWIGLLSLAASACVLGVLPPRARPGDPAARVLWAFALICILAPAHTALRHGQTTPLVLLAVSGYLVASLRGRPWTAGSLLALATLVKLPLLALPLLDILRSRWRTFGAWLGATLVLVLLSISVFGVDLHRQYIDGLSQHAGTVMTGHNNQSILAVAARMVREAPVNDWIPRPVPAAAYLVAAIVAMVLAAVLAAGLFRRLPPLRQASSTSRRYLEFGAVVSAGLVAMPVAWDHYFLLLAPALLAISAGLGERGVLRRPVAAATLALAALAVILPTPGRFLDGTGTSGPLASLVLSHYFLGAVLLVFLSAAGLLSRDRESPTEEAP